MTDTKVRQLTFAIRQHLNLPTSLAISFVLASSTATHAVQLPDTNSSKQDSWPGPAASKRELLFVDSGVESPEQLLIALQPNIETVILQPNRDGLEQITEVLQDRRDIKAVHIVAHGEAGVLRLGNTHLDHNELNKRAASLQGWFNEHAPGTDNPDLLLYACNLAQDQKGAAFVEQLAKLTGADVAASTDVSGAGGDWELEYHLGSVETPTAFVLAQAADYPYKLATFTVTNTADSGAGSLREAIGFANAAGGADIVDFAGGVTGTITLTSGELAVTDDLTINGPGATTLTISGNDASRILNVFGASAFTLRDLTLRDGNANDGGAIVLNDIPSALIEDSVITSNSSSDDGGAIYIDEGNTTIRRTEISDNYAADYGGGIWFYMDGTDTLTVEDSLITRNTASAGGGGIAAYADDEGGTVYVRNSTISNNTAYEGGGIDFYSDDDGYLVVENSTISDNYAADDGGGIAFYGDDGRLTIINSTISGNSTGSGGGGGIMIEDAGSNTLIQNSTIVGNTSSTGGGGIYVDDGYLILENSIIADNNDPSSPDIEGTVYSTYSLIGDSTGATITDNGGTLTDVNARVSPTLVNAGGLNRVHLLQFGSPAINAGEPGASPLSFDQRGSGFPRILEGRLDMGAVEEIPTPPTPVPVFQHWALILLGLLMPGVAYRYRRRLEQKQRRR